MSFTEAGRLTALQQTIRACTVNDAIEKIRCSRKDPYGNSSAAGYGNSESGRLSAALANSNCCVVAPVVTSGTNCTTCMDMGTGPPRTVQAESQYIKKVAAAAVACGPSGIGPYVLPTTGQIQRISAGGISESVRIRRLQDEVEYIDYTINPNARFLPYQRFFPTPCPPAPVANNQPLTQPRFPCAPNVVGFT